MNIEQKKQLTQILIEIKKKDFDITHLAHVSKVVDHRIQQAIEGKVKLYEEEYLSLKRAYKAFINTHY